MVIAKRWTQLHARLHQILRDRQLIPRSQRVLLAVSGGQDSTCLGQLMKDLQSKWEWHLAIAHCDHGWSSDAGIAEFVRQLAGKRWQLPFWLKTAQPLKETEAAARAWRYQALNEIATAGQFTHVVTAHTLSDCAETQLYNLIRGAGTAGLSSLTWQRQLTPHRQLIRPLLSVSRAETRQFCQQFQLPIWEDAANDSLQFARNRIRHQLIPYLQRHFNPQVEQALAHTADILQAESQYLDATAQQLYQRSKSDDIEQINRILLRQQPLPLQRRIIRLFLQQRLPTNPNYEQIEALISLIDAPHRTQTASLPGGAIAQAHNEWIRLKTPIEPSEPSNPS